MRSRCGIAGIATTIALVAYVGAALASAPPVGALPAGPVSVLRTKPGLLLAVALPQPAASTGLVWRVARRYNANVVRQIDEAEVGRSVVLVFKVVGRGDTSLVFAQTRGDASPKALKAQTYKIHSR